MLQHILQHNLQHKRCKTMTDNSNFQQSAQQFIDFWQEQTRRSMQDERFLSAMMEMMSAMPPTHNFSSPPFTGHPFHSQNQTAYPSPFTNTQEPHAAAQSTATAQPTAPTHHPVAATNDPRHVELAELLRRVERCEARIGILEDALRAAYARDDRMAEPPPAQP